MGVISKEALERIKEVSAKHRKEIQDFMPIINAELKSLSETQFIQKVCKGIGHEREDVKEGKTLYQCAYYNRRYFDKLNSGKRELIKLACDEPLIEVEVKGLAKFAFRCPNAGTRLCRMTDFKFSSNFEEKVKEF